MRVETSRDRSRLEQFLRLDAATHVYPLADLDDFFWADTTWYTAVEGARITAVCLVLETLSPPIVYAVGRTGDTTTARLVAAIRDRLPQTFFANLGLDVVEVLRSDHRLRAESLFQKMILPRDVALPGPSSPDSAIESLGPQDFEELRDFYRRDAYAPGESDARYFEPYMLEMGPYSGIREDAKLVAVGGVHLRSDRYRVAALGNLATRPDRRGHGLGRRIVADLCRKLRDHADWIGLNVMTVNAPAIRCYESLGFQARVRYLEGVFTRIGSEI